MEACVVTQAQRDAFRTFGYLKFAGAIPAVEAEAVSREFEAQMEQSEPQSRVTADGQQQESHQSFIERSELLLDVAERRICGPLESLLGGELVWVASGGYLYSGPTPWHRCSSIFGPHSPRCPPALLLVRQLRLPGKLTATPPPSRGLTPTPNLSRKPTP